MFEAFGDQPATGCSIVAVNSGKLWQESLERFFAGTRFVVHPEPDRLLGNAIVDLPLGQPSIFLYRDYSATGNCVDWIRDNHPRLGAAKIVVIVSRLRLELFVRAMQAGADGFLTDDISGAALVQSLELIVAGEKVLPGLLADFIAQQGIHPLFREEAPDSRLSPRESDILKRLAHGQSNKAIANALDVSESTVKGSVKGILRKIAAQNRTQAAVWALNEGLLLSEDEPLPKLR
jgi:two-component system, NarL family, nitrate/nitrite response regulator NarL